VYRTKLWKKDAKVSMEKGRTECYAKWTRGANTGSLRMELPGIQIRKL